MGSTAIPQGIQDDLEGERGLLPAGVIKVKTWKRRAEVIKTGAQGSGRKMFLRQPFGNQCRSMTVHGRTHDRVDRIEAGLSLYLHPDFVAVLVFEFLIIAPDVTGLLEEGLRNRL